MVTAPAFARSDSRRSWVMGVPRGVGVAVAELLLGQQVGLGHHPDDTALALQDGQGADPFQSCIIRTISLKAECRT